MSKTTYKNVNAMPTWKLREILNHPHCVGIDGADYEPVKDELQAELWKRDNAEAERIVHAHEKAMKEQRKWEATSHKRK